MFGRGGQPKPPEMKTAGMNPAALGTDDNGPTDQRPPPSGTISIDRMLNLFPVLPVRFWITNTVG